MSARTISLLILTLILSACNTTPGPQLSIEDAWTQQAKVSEITAGDLNQTCICERVVATNAYLRITNQGREADRLTRVETDAAVTVELRQTGMSESFVEPVVLDGVDIPARGAADFSPGSYAMVLKDLRGDLEPGDQVRLELFFEKSDPIEVTSEVR